MYIYIYIYIYSQSRRLCEKINNEKIRFFWIFFIFQGNKHQKGIPENPYRVTIQTLGTQENKDKGRMTDKDDDLKDKFEV